MVVGDAAHIPENTTFIVDFIYYMHSRPDCHH